MNRVPSLDCRNRPLSRTDCQRDWMKEFSRSASKRITTWRRLFTRIWKPSLQERELPYPRCKPLKRKTDDKYWHKTQYLSSVLGWNCSRKKAAGLLSPHRHDAWLVAATVPTDYSATAAPCTSQRKSRRQQKKRLDKVSTFGQKPWWCGCSSRGNFGKPHYCSLCNGGCWWNHPHSGYYRLPSAITSWR